MLLLGKSRDQRLTILEIPVEYETNQDLTKLLIKLHFKRYLIKNREESRVGIYLGKVSAQFFFFFISDQTNQEQTLCLNHCRSQVSGHPF